MIDALAPVFRQTLSWPLLHVNPPAACPTDEYVTGNSDPHTPGADRRLVKKVSFHYGEDVFDDLDIHKAKRKPRRRTGLGFKVPKVTDEVIPSRLRYFLLYVLINANLQTEASYGKWLDLFDLAGGEDNIDYGQVSSTAYISTKSNASLRSGSLDRSKSRKLPWQT